MLPPRAALPSHRFLRDDYAVVVLKGQGRATVGQHTATIVPGVSITVPRQTWYSLRNTGTGTLQVVWTASSPSVLAWFRELARATDAPAVSAAAQHHGVELAGEPAQEAVPAERHHKRRRRGGRGRRRGPPSAAAPQPPAAAAPAAGQPVSAAPAAIPPHAQARRAPRQGRRGARAAPAARSNPPRSARGRPRHSRRVKEVYMGGRWVRVEGEGPVIASGEEHARRQKRTPDDGDAPAGPLSVTP